MLLNLLNEKCAIFMSIAEFYFTRRHILISAKLLYNYNEDDGFTTVAN